MEEELDGLSAQELLEKRDGIELEIREQLAVLEQEGGVGMKGALVDREGFPRGDVDIYVVRTARQKVLCLQNDHKSLMKLLEKKLHAIHAEERERRGPTDELPSNQPVTRARGFVIVNQVSPGSPAAVAGLSVGDQICEFGSIKSENFQSLQDIATVVQHSQNSTVRVVVLRGGVTTVLSLRPQRWSGRGLLGCNIVLPT
ncbi:26S proteasome non-ATPase regulatory subunit 9-like [Halichondria panicea]|uniref:26S proteasome non-ATPase regulatory subunit 9-like n=1 Tax=Halichondria panicea TaxID=6063 RepID=UPI00312B8050